MKQLHLLMATILALLFGGGSVAWAQEDVTSRYFSDPGFDQETAVTTGICTYNYDCQANATTYSGLQALAGWTPNQAGDSEDVAQGSHSVNRPGDARAGGVFAYGGDAFLGGAAFKAPAADGTHTGNALGIVNVWSAEGYYESAEVTLSAGGYTLTMDVYNAGGANAVTSRTGFVTSDEGNSFYCTTTTFTVGSWTTITVNFTLTEETTGHFRLGYKSNGSGSNANPHLFFDNLTLKYTDPLAAAKAAYQSALDAANAALQSADYANVTGQERTALVAATTAVTPTTEAAYAEATTALTTATATFTAAKASYDSFAAAKAVAAQLGVESSATPATADEAVTAMHGLNVDTWNAVESGYPASIALGTWTGDMTDNHGQHWSGDASRTYKEQAGADWGHSSWSRSLTQTVTLPAGSYVFMATGRKAANASLQMQVAYGDMTTTVADFPSADRGHGVTTSGAASFDDNSTYVNYADNDNAGRGWQWRFIPFTLTAETAVTITVGGSTQTEHQWMSICDFAIRTSADSPALVAAAKEALKAAIDSATAINATLASATLAAAIATAQGVYDDTSATKADVEAATATLRAAAAEALSHIESGTNVTALFIQNPSFETGDLTGWDVMPGPNSNTVTADVLKNEGDYAFAGVDGSFYLNTSTTNDQYPCGVRQTITALSEGYYQLTASLATGNTVSLQAGDAQTSVTGLDADSLADATTGFVHVDGGASLLIGATSANGFKADHFRLVYYTAKGMYEKVLAEAKATLNDAAYANVTGDERTNLATATSAAEPTTDDGYAQAAQNLTTLAATFTAAKASYDRYAANHEAAEALARDLGVTYITAPTTAAEADAFFNNLNVAEYQAVNDRYTASISLGTWTTTGNVTDNHGQHWSGDASRTYKEQSSSDWSASSWAISLSQTVTLPAGSYVFKATGRKADKASLQLRVAHGDESTIVSDFPSGDTGRGVTTSGVASFADPSDDVAYTNDNQGRGWQWRFVPFTLTETAGVTIEVTASANEAHQWVSFCDYSIMADPISAAKAALTAAIDSAKTVNGVLDNSTLAAAIATAQGVYDDAASTLEEVEAATTTLREAVAEAKKHIANGTDVTALFVQNPSFETGDLTGWAANRANDTGVKPNSDATYTTTGVDGSYLFNTWGGTDEKYLRQTLTGLPEGYYQVTALVASDAGNAVSLLAGSTQKTVSASEEGKGVFVTGVTGKVHVDEDGSLLIGATSTNWYKADDFHLIYYTVAAVEEEVYEDALAAAKAALANDDYANVTGNERTALENTIQANENVTSGYAEATNALTTATAAFTGAKAAYDRYAAETTLATAMGATGIEPLTAADGLDEALRTLNVAEYNAAVANYTGNLTDSYDTEWTTNTFGSNQGQHWDGTSSTSYLDKWDGNTATFSATKTLTLPAGKWVLKASGRSNGGASAFTMEAGGTTVAFPSKGATGYGITTDGTASFEAPVEEGTYANGNNGYGWEWRFIPLTLTEETEVAVTVTANLTDSWTGFCDFTILRAVEEVTLADDATAAPAANAYANVTYDRTLLAGFNSIVLPFATTTEELGVESAYELTGTTPVAGKQGAFSIDFASVTTLEANTPYVVKAAADTKLPAFKGKAVAPDGDLSVDGGNGFTLQGTYVAYEKGSSPIQKDDYIVVEQGFANAKGGNELHAFRAWLRNSGTGEAKAFTIDGEEVTGIRAIALESALTGKAYNLQGQRVEKPRHGVFIIDGRKVVVK